MTSPVDTSVKIFHSEQTNAPVLTGQAGSLKALLDAVLVDGYGIKTGSGLVVASGVATISGISGHDFFVDDVVLVAGSTPSALNGEQKVIAVTSSSVSYATAQSDQTATGTITVKNAPLGWTLAFAGTNKGAYKPTDVTATGCSVRVDDTGTTNARVVGYETMSDIDTGSGPFPTGAQQSGGLYWSKSYSADSTPRKWMIFGDALGFYFCVAPGTQTGNYQAMWFGDITSFKSGDAYGAVLSGNSVDTTNSGSYPDGCLGRSTKNDANYVYVARNYVGIGGAQVAKRIGSGQTQSSDCYSGSYQYAYGSFPNNANNGLFLCDVLCFTGGGYRGEFPGIRHAIQACETAFSTRDAVAGTGPLAGKKVMALRVGLSASSTIGNAFFDITGPWRT